MKLAKLTQHSFINGAEFTPTEKPDRIYYAVCQDNNQIVIIDNHDKRDVANAVSVNSKGFVAVSNFFGRIVTAEVKFNNCREVIR